MYSFVLEWTPALTTGKATYNYRFLLFLSVYVFSVKVLIKDTVSTPPTREGIAILLGHLLNSKV